MQRQLAQREVDRLVSIIKYIGENKIDKAKAEMNQYKNPTLMIRLNAIIDKLSKYHERIQSLQKSLKQKDEEIKKINVKMDEKQFSKRKGLLSEGDNQRLKIIGLIQSQNLSQALQTAKNNNLLVANSINQLCEYRSLKSIRIFMKNQNEGSLKKYEHKWSAEGQQMRIWLEQQSKLRLQTNRQFCTMIQGFFNQDNKVIQNMPKKYFNNETRQKFIQLHCFIMQYKQIAIQNQQQEAMFMNNALSCLREIGSDILKDYKYSSCSIFWLCQALLQRIKKQESKVSQYSLQLFVQQINKAIVRFETIDTANIKIALHSSNPQKMIKEILTFIKNILNLIWGKQQQISYNKALLNKINDQSYILVQTIVQIAQKLGLNNQTRNHINSIDDISKITTSIESKIKQILHEKEQNQRKFDIQEFTNDEIDISEQDVADLPIKRIKTVQSSAEQYLSENLVLNKKLQELTKKYNEMKEQQQQQTEISHRHKQTSIVLQRKLKTMQAPQSSIYLSNTFGEDELIRLALHEEKVKLMSQKSALEKQLEDKNNMISNFQSIKASIASQKEKEKQKEIVKLKETIKGLKQKLNDSYQQTRQLYEMLQEKNQLIKASSEIILAFNSEKDLHSQKQEEQKAVEKEIVELNNIHENCQIELKKQIEKHQISSENLLKKQNQLILQLQSIEDSSLKYQKEFSEQKIKILKRHKEEIENISVQLQNQKKKYRMAQIGKITNLPINLESNHLFAYGTSIFDQVDYEQRMYLLQTLRTYTYRVNKTRLLYRLDEYNKVSFHRYVDHHSHVVVIIKTVFGKLIAGYYQKPLVPSGMQQGFGLIMSLWNKKTYVVKDKRAISYDDYFIIFGNSQIRLKNLQYKLFSNFGISNSYYDSKGLKINDFLGEGNERQVDIVGFEIYSLQFDL